MSTLPIEIWISIGNMLRQDSFDVWPYTDEVEARRALQNLRLTSKRFAVIFLPTLFHHIGLEDYRLQDIMEDKEQTARQLFRHTKYLQLRRPANCFCSDVPYTLVPLAAGSQTRPDARLADMERRDLVSVESFNLVRDYFVNLEHVDATRSCRLQAWNRFWRYDPYSNCPGADWSWWVSADYHALDATFRFLSLRTIASAKFHVLVPAIDSKYQIALIQQPALADCLTSLEFVYSVLNNALSKLQTIRHHDRDEWSDYLDFAALCRNLKYLTIGFNGPPKVEPVASDDPRVADYELSYIFPNHSDEDRVKQLLRHYKLFYPMMDDLISVGGDVPDPYHDFPDELSFKMNHMPYLGSVKVLTLKHCSIHLAGLEALRRHNAGLVEEIRLQHVLIMDSSKQEHTDRPSHYVARIRDFEDDVYVPEIMEQFTHADENREKWKIEDLTENYCLTLWW